MEGQRVFGKEGFTEKALQLLLPYNNQGSDQQIMYENVPARVLLEVVKILPREQLKDRQNDSPLLQTFVKVAESLDGCMFDMYSICPQRLDERITVEAISIPPDQYKKINKLDTITRKDLKQAIKKAGQFDGITIKEKKFIFIWWN